MIKEKDFENKLVKIKTSKESYEGKIIPSHDPKIIILKQKSGYNIGILKTTIREVKIIGKIEEKSKEIKEIKQDSQLPKIAIITTGGTISDKVDYKTGGVTPIKDPKELMNVFPEISKIARIEFHNLFEIDSSDISIKHWKKLGKKIFELLNQKDISGIVILSGTDTLSYTSSYISFAIKNINKPVVFTYSHRSIDRGSSDGFLNLKHSVLFALENFAGVVAIGHENENDSSCIAIYGTKLRKMHSTKRDAFKPINDSPIARIEKSVEFLKEHKKKNQDKINLFENFEEKIGLIKFHPNISPEVLDFYIKKKYRGLIIEGFGLGLLTIEGENSWFQKLKEAISKGVFIGITTQTIYGEVNPNVYSIARKLNEIGCVYLKDMLSETAFVKLGFVLGKESNKEIIKEMMLDNWEHEFNPRFI